MKANLRRTVRPLAAAAAAFAMGSTVLADVPTLSGTPCVVSEGLGLSERDTFRLENLMTSRTRGFAGALRAENGEDRAVVSGLFQAGLAPVAAIPEGRYQCRTIKMGGIGPLVVYGWFQCEITAGDAGLRIEKLTGSQRLSGRLTPAGEGLAYRGALHYSHEEPRDHGNAEFDQVGCLTKQFEDGGSFVLELPMPVFESEHDIIELVPAD